MNKLQLIAEQFDKLVNLPMIKDGYRYYASKAVEDTCEFAEGIRWMKFAGITYFVESK